MKNRVLILLTIWILAGLPGALRAQEIVHSVRHYSAANGLSQNTVMTILQDRDGFMWFGTWDGLNRFDGYEFKVYKPAPIESNGASNRVDKLHEDSLGYLWMHAYDGGFYRLNKHTDQLQPTPVKSTRFGNRLTYRSNYLEQKKGVIWITGEDRLLRVLEDEADSDDNDLKMTVFKLSEEANFLLTDRQENLWAGTSKGVECISSNDKQTLYAPGKSANDNHFTCGLNADQHLWFGTESGTLWRYSLQKKQFTRIALPIGSTISNILSLNDHQLLLTTDKEGFLTYDTQNGLVALYSSKTTKSIRSNRFTNAFRASDGRIWLLNEEYGIWRFTPGTGEIRRYTSTPDKRFEGLQFNHFFAFEDAQGRLWLNPYGGGFAMYDATTDQLISPLGGVSNMVHSAYIDRSNRLWVGSYSLGLDCITTQPKLFEVRDTRSVNPLSCEVRALLQMQNGDLLEAGKDKTIRLYDNQHRLKGTKPTPQLVYSMLEAPDGTMLLGTKGDGLITIQGQRITKTSHLDSDPTSLLCDNIYDMAFGSDSSLYLATYDGGVNILRNGQFIHCKNGWNNYPNDFGSKARCLLFLDDTTLLAGTTNGLLRINTRTLATRQTPYYDIRCMAFDQQGNLWVGSFGGGLLMISNPHQEDILAEDNCRHFSTHDGLSSDIVLSIVMDKEDELWLTTENTICRYQRDSHTFLTYNPLSATNNAVFGEAKGICLQSGEIYFGHSGGDCSFLPDRIIRSDEFPPLHFTDFVILDKHGRRTMLEDQIIYSPSIRLTHNETVFSIGFAAQEYDHPEKIQYAYRLDDVDKEWNHVGTERHVTYSNLPAGDYVFRLICTNADGIWSEKEVVLHLHISPSPWVSWWAILLYLAALCGIGYWLYKTFAAGNRIRQELEVEQKVTDIKLRFFTNISHELRTPLTLITGPVESLLRSETLSPIAKTQLQIVSSNASRMLRLINQILDFRKIQNQKMRLRVQQFDLVKQAEETADNFRKEAADKRISFRIEHNVEDPMVWADKERIDTILYNLLANAFKFTPAGQTVTLRVSDKPNFLLLEVQDTGVGIPKEKRSVLFQRFSSNNEINPTKDKTGTGIGLNLVKELVSLHGGYIEVDSEVGVGSTFKVMLRRGKEHYGSDVDIIVGDTSTLESVQPVAEEPEEPIKMHKETILVVDDNSDMRTFLTEIFQNDYNVLDAENGEHALKLARKNNPSLIITDLMMPEMDGLELTNHLKSDILTSHIPVILLTAKSAIESRLEALRYGADDYITKPFSPEYLIARVVNLLAQRERLREAYRSLILSPQEEVTATPQTPDEIFLAHLYDFMVQNMDNNNLSVEDLVREMALGRTVFFNKLKSLTGLSPVEYIRDIRIKKAAELLLDGRYNITEVTYMVGLNDSRYFAKCFKKAYGVTPTEYKRQQQVGGTES